jgi:ribulose-5-phosphate 4-epimerase/fuculose-1-phosphate aldolase
MEREGVIQFQALHDEGPLGAELEGHARALSGWRAVLKALGVVGQDPRRYEGLGFGNLSVRVPPFRGPRGQESAFLVTGTQTGAKERLSLENVCVVERWDLRKNRVWSRGRALPSSESLTHGAVYDVVPGARAVLHVHAPAIFTRAHALSLPATPPDVGYGTPAMAASVSRLWQETDLRTVRVFVMAGHEDGVVAFGSDLADAGARLMDVLALALAQS